MLSCHRLFSPTATTMPVFQNECNCNANICGKSFSLKGNLKKHIHTIHEGQKIKNVNPFLEQKI